MSPKVIGGLAVLTLVTLVAAVVAAVAEPEVGTVQVAHEPAFPALRAQPDAVAKVTIRAQGQSATLERAAPDRWVAPERAGYPVAAGQVRDLIVRLADMRLIEPKTSNPERFARLEVEDVDAEGAKSRLVRLEDGRGQVLAEAIIGKRRQRLTGALASGVYLRRPGEQQSWLASGGPDVHAAVQDWLDQAIVDVAADTVRRIEVQPAEGPAYAVVRDAPGEPLRLEDLQAGEALKEDADLQSLAGAFSRLELEDVRPGGELAWPAEQHRVRFTTFDDLEIAARLAEVDDQPWLQLEGARALTADEAGAGQAEVPQPDPSTAAATAGDAPPGEGPESEDVAEAAEAPAVSAAERAEQIAARTESWAYRVPSHLFERLTKTRAAWLKPADETS